MQRHAEYLSMIMCLSAMSGCAPNRPPPFAIHCRSEVDSVTSLTLAFDSRRQKILRLASSDLGRSVFADYCPNCTVAITSEQVTAIDRAHRYRLDIDRRSGHAVEQTFGKISEKYICEPTRYPKVPESRSKF
jgi:hypothetical protein